MLNELEQDEPVQYDCVECPLCNASFARDGLAKRIQVLNEMQIVLDDIDISVPNFNESESELPSQSDLSQSRIEGSPAHLQGNNEAQPEVAPFNVAAVERARERVEKMRGLRRA